MGQEQGLAIHWRQLQSRTFLAIEVYLSDRYVIVEKLPLASKLSAQLLMAQVKPNVGHSEGASGLTSLFKAALSLENKIIPPNINFSKPNPKSRGF